MNRDTLLIALVSMGFFAAATLDIYFDSILITFLMLFISWIVYEQILSNRFRRLHVFHWYIAPTIIACTFIAKIVLNLDFINTLIVLAASTCWWSTGFHKSSKKSG